jgi:predicted DCC family thiol-disulfide oxidoreductase YuxK
MEQELIIIFDGECNLCHSSVAFIIDRDRKSKFKFASDQSKTGVELQENMALM